MARCIFKVAVQLARVVFVPRNQFLQSKSAALVGCQCGCVHHRAREADGGRAGEDAITISQATVRDTLLLGRQ